MANERVEMAGELQQASFFDSRQLDELCLQALSAPRPFT